MNILILSRHDERPDFDQIYTYKSALEASEVSNTYSYGELESLVFAYDGKRLSVTSQGTDIAEYDGIFMIGWFKTKILEDIALSAATYAAANNVKIWNSEVLYTRSRSKLSQYVMAVLADVAMMPFMFCKDAATLGDNVSLWNGGYPVIAKGVLASRGDDNYKLDDEAAVLNTLSKSDSDTGPWFVLQGFVPNDGDYRVIVMGDTVRLVIHRVSEDETTHINNTSKGGTATVVATDELPDDVRAQCVRLAQRLRREITGVDMIRNRQTDKFYLLEINNMPQLATGSMVGMKMTELDRYLQS